MYHHTLKQTSLVPTRNTPLKAAHRLAHTKLRLMAHVIQLSPSHQSVGPAKHRYGLTDGNAQARRGHKHGHREIRFQYPSTAVELQTSIPSPVSSDLSFHFNHRPMLSPMLHHRYLWLHHDGNNIPYALICILPY